MTASLVPPPFDPAIYGTDLDIDNNGPSSVWGLATGLKNLGNAHIRRMTTPPGGLWYDPTYVSCDIFELLNQTIITTRDLAVWEANIGHAIEDDERVDSCSVNLSYDPTSEACTIRIEETLVTGQTFSLVILAQNATVTLLQIDGVSAQAAASGTQAAPGVQLAVGPAGPAGAQGEKGSAGTSGTPQWTSRLATSEGYDDTGTEQVVDQFWIDFDSLPSPNITVELIADFYTTGGATGTFRVRIGGTKGNADGTLEGTPITTVAGTPTRQTFSATIPNPGGTKYLTISAQTSNPGDKAVISDDRALTIR